MSSPRRPPHLRVVGQARTGRLARSLSMSGAPATVVLLGLMAVVFVAQLVVPRWQAWLLTGSWHGYAFDYWRPLAHVLTTGSVLQLLVNGFALYWMGRGLEGTLGSRHFVAMFLLAGLGAGTVLTLAGPPLAVGGSFTGIMGLLAAQTVVKQAARLDVRADIALIVLLVLMNLLGGGGIVGGRQALLHGEWLADLGSLGVGASIGWVQAHAPWRQRGRRLSMAYVAIAAVCVLSLTLAWVS